MPSRQARIITDVLGNCAQALEHRGPLTLNSPSAPLATTDGNALNIPAGSTEYVGGTLTVAGRLNLTGATVTGLVGTSDAVAGEFSGATYSYVAPALATIVNNGAVCTGGVAGNVFDEALIIPTAGWYLISFTAAVIATNASAITEIAAPALFKIQVNGFDLDGVGGVDLIRIDGTPVTATVALVKIKLMSPGDLVKVTVSASDDLTIFPTTSVVRIGN